MNRNRGGTYSHAWTVVVSLSSRKERNNYGIKGTKGREDGFRVTYQTVIWRNTHWPL